MLFGKTNAKPSSIGLTMHRPSFCLVLFWFCFVFDLINSRSLTVVLVCLWWMGIIRNANSENINNIVKGPKTWNGRCSKSELLNHLIKIKGLTTFLQYNYYSHSTQSILLFYYVLIRLRSTAKHWFDYDVAMIIIINNQRQ